MRKMHYKGYTGIVNYDEDDKIFHGKLDLFRDLVTFESKTSTGIREEFKKAIEDYRNTLAELYNVPKYEYIDEASNINPEDLKKFFKDLLEK